MRKNKREHGKQTREAIYKSIVSYICEHSYPPTNREIGQMVGLKSTSSVYTQLLTMRETGMIESDKGFGVPRAIRVPGYKFVKEEPDESKSREEKYTLDQIIDAMVQADGVIILAIKNQDREGVKNVLKDYLQAGVSAEGEKAGLNN